MRSNEAKEKADTFISTFSCNTQNSERTFLGIVSFILLCFVSLLPQDYEKYNIPLFFEVWAVISSIFVAVGILPLLLGKYCKKYQIWIEKEVKSYQNKMSKRAEKSIKKEMRKHK